MTSHIIGIEDEVIPLGNFQRPQDQEINDGKLVIMTSE